MNEKLIEGLIISILSFVMCFLYVAFWTWITPLSWQDVTLFSIFVSLISFSARMNIRLGMT